MSTDAYTYVSRKDGEVVIFHHGRLAKMLRGDAAEALVASVTGASSADAQAAMAAAAGGDGQSANPASGTGNVDRGFHGGGAAHGHKEFRRKSG